jgi:aquaporin Z
VRCRYLIRFEEDMLAPRPLWIPLIIEFLGMFVLVTVAAGSGVTNHYAGGGPISRTAAVIAPGAVVMAMIYAWGPAVRAAHQPRSDHRVHRPWGIPHPMG